VGRRQPRRPRLLPRALRRRDRDRAAYRRLLAASFGEAARAAGWRPRRDEPAAAGTLRPRLLAAAAIVGGDAKLLATARKLAAAYLRKPSSMDPGLAAVALVAATHGGDDALARRLDAAFTRSRDHNGTCRSATWAATTAPR
jgi:hypothetical protein